MACTHSVSSSDTCPMMGSDNPNIKMNAENIKMNAEVWEEIIETKLIWSSDEEDPEEEDPEEEDDEEGDLEDAAKLCAMINYIAENGKEAHEVYEKMEKKHKDFGLNEEKKEDELFWIRVHTKSYLRYFKKFLQEIDSPESKVLIEKIPQNIPVQNDFMKIYWIYIQILFAFYVYNAYEDYKELEDIFLQAIKNFLITLE